MKVFSQKQEDQGHLWLESTRNIVKRPTDNIVVWKLKWHKWDLYQLDLKL